MRLFHCALNQEICGLRYMLHLQGKIKRKIEEIRVQNDLDQK